MLTHDEMRRFLIQAKQDDFYELALLELATGMRRGEICALKWSDLNFRTGKLHIQRQACHVNHGVIISTPKTKNSDRTIVLPQSVVNVLKEYRARCDSEWIFPSPKKEGEPIDPTSVYRKMRKVLDRAQCKQVRFHDLRHPYVKLKTKKFENFYYESRRTDFTLPPALALWLVRCQKVIANVIYLNTIVLEDIYTAYQAVRK